jgi:1,4-dihydroxy-2-naphthoate octaprenyltransferase
MTRLKTIIQILRAPFFTSVIVPVLLGTTVARLEGYFHWGYFLLTLIGMIFINAGMNLSNDYFDHRSGVDEINKELTPFSGGSRSIQNSLISAKQVLVWSIVCYAAGSGIGLYLAATRGWTVLALGIIGVFLAVFHNGPPIKLYHLAPGLGELAAGIGCGPLIVLGTYYVQTQQLSLRPVWASIPVGLLITAVLYINEFPDHDADKAAGKKTVPVALGRQRAVWGYVTLIVSAYTAIGFGVVLDLFPYATLLTFLTLPLAYRCAGRITHPFYIAANNPVLW